MRIGLLGEMTIDGQPSRLSPRDRVVLTRLALAADSVVTRDLLVDALWGGEAPPSASKVLQGAIVRLRRRLGSATVETTPSGYRLVLPPTEVDVLLFRDLTRRFRELVDIGAVERAAHLAGQALALWPPATSSPLPELGIDIGERIQLEDMLRTVEEERLGLLLAQRSGGDLVEQAAALVDAEPHREHRWILLARAQYRVGRQADALRTIQRARRSLREDLGLDVSPELAELERNILVQHPSLDAPIEAATAMADDPMACPYRGLLAYEVEDREVFYGRERVVGDALTRLAQTGSLVLVGPSGSGKSSVLKAGVVATLRAEGRAVDVFHPGMAPASLVARLDAQPVGSVVAIDQFEELLELAGAQAVSVLAALESSSRRGSLIVALRADRLDRVNGLPWLAELAERSLLLLRPPDAEDLRSAIVGPATTAGLRLEPGLVELILRDVVGEPGALPLMSHALRATWLGREGRTLTVDAYERAGGLRGSIAAAADHVYGELSELERNRMRRLMLRLFNTSSDSHPTRARVPLEAAVDEVGDRGLIDRLLAARLVVAGDDGLTVAHEALATAWPRLAAWIGDDRGASQRRHRLHEAATTWDSMGRPESELYSGARLEAVLEQLPAVELSDLEMAFLDAGREARDAGLLRERRSTRRLRRLLAACGVLLVGALIAGSVAVGQRDRARAATQAAAAAERETATAAVAARLGELTSTAESLYGSQRDLGVLLAAEANRMAPSVRTRSALLRAFTESPGLLGYRWLAGASAGRDAVAVDDGTIALVDNQLAVWLVGAEPGAASQSVADSLGPGSGLVAADPRGRRLVAYRDPADGNTMLDVYDVASRRVVASLAADSGRTSLAVSPSGEFVALAGGAVDGVEVFAVSTSESIGTIATTSDVPVPSPARTAAVAFSPDGLLYVTDLSGMARSYRVPDLALVQELPPAAGTAAPTGGLVFADDGAALIAFGQQDGPRQGSILARWDLRRGTLVYSESARRPCDEAAYLARADTLYCAYRRGSLEMIDATSGVTTGTLDLQQGQYGALAALPDGTRLVAASASQPVMSVWDATGRGPITAVDAATAGDDNPVGYSADGTRLLATVIGGSLSDDPSNPFLAPDLIDTTTAAVIDPLDSMLAAAWLGDRLAFIGREGLGIYDFATRTTTPVDVSTLTGQVIMSTENSANGQLVLWLDDGSAFVIDGATGVLSRAPFGAREAREAAFTRDGASVAVIDGDHQLRMFDATTGALLAGPLAEFESVSAGPEFLVAGDRSGWVHRLAPEDLGELDDPLNVGNGPVYDVHLSADAALLAARTSDTVRLFDMASLRELGGPIAVARGDYARGSALRPEGAQLAASTATGLALWNLDDASVNDGACQLAGRNLTREEWDAHIGDLAAYRRTCPQFPPGR